MNVTFSHETALEFLRSVPPQAGAYSRENLSISIQTATTGYRDLRKLDLASYGISCRPLHVLIEKGTRRCQSPGVSCHEHGYARLPEGYLLILGPGVFACGPELVFIQLARTLPLIDAVCLGYELCGCYSHFAAEVSGFYDRPPLTTVEALAEGIRRHARMRGIDKAREALRYVRAGSRSPMETVTCCLLTLPPSMGGFGFSVPELNWSVELDPTAEKLAGTKTCCIDLAWPSAKTGLEYNGRDFHLNHAKDRRRVEALEHMGWSIKTVEFDQLSDLGQLGTVARLLDGKVERSAEDEASFVEKRKLRDALLRATRSGLGLEDALFGVPVKRGSVAYHVQ